MPWFKQRVFDTKKVFFKDLILDSRKIRRRKIQVEVKSQKSVGTSKAK